MSFPSIYRNRHQHKRYLFSVLRVKKPMITLQLTADECLSIVIRYVYFATRCLLLLLQVSNALGTAKANIQFFISSTFVRVLFLLYLNIMLPHIQVYTCAEIHFIVPTFRGTFFKERFSISIQ